MSCHDVGARSIAALAGTFAAGSQEYIGHEKASPYLIHSNERDVAIRWNGYATTELGSGIAEGVNANGTSVGNDGRRPVEWEDGTVTRLESGGETGDAVAITESGRTIVGNLGSDAVRWQADHVRTLDSPAPQRRRWHLAEVSGITPNGTIFRTADSGSRVAVFELTAP